MTHWQTTRYRIDLSQPRVMGIVNVTPDSFADGGRYADTASALRHCERLLRDGAHILDIGGESTRPGSPPLALTEELARVLPVVRQAVKFGVPISVDTYKPEVMTAALDLGADIINDIWALRHPGHNGGPSALEVIARQPACGVCLMHMHGNPQTMQRSPMEGDAVPLVLLFLQQVTQALRAHGVDKSRIVVDPGIGFGKTVAQNFALLARQAQLLTAGYPLLAGWSRKSSIGAALQDDGKAAVSPHERVAGSVAAALLAVERGASVVRVHDVRETVQALAVWRHMRAAA
ncbi:MAG: dihydropteroate synthase [Burkholderiaceae bacterium]|jgi:dihydropteroate synthase|nr:dihydropteroate synthase [Burkholderiaceae bacterium]